MNFLENLTTKLNKSPGTFLDSGFSKDNPKFDYPIQCIGGSFNFFERIHPPTTNVQTKFTENLRMPSDFGFFAENPKFTDEHLLQPSSFPNGSVCGHLHEIRRINFGSSKQNPESAKANELSSNFVPNNDNKSYKKINIKPVDLKIKTR